MSNLIRLPPSTNMTAQQALQSAWLCLEEIGSQMLHDGVPIDATHPKRIAMTRCYEITNEIAKRLEKS